MKISSTYKNKFDTPPRFYRKHYTLAIDSRLASRSAFPECNPFAFFFVFYPLP